MGRKTEKKLVKNLLKSLLELEDLLIKHENVIKDKYEELMTELRSKIDYIETFLEIQTPNFLEFKYRVKCPHCDKFLLNLSSTHLITHGLSKEEMDINKNNECSNFIISAKKYLTHKLNPRLGFKYSDETKSKISQSLKGKNTWTKGKTWTQERKEKITGENNGMTKLWGSLSDEEKNNWKVKGQSNGLKAIGCVSPEGKIAQKEAAERYWGDEDNRKRQSIRLSGENNGMYGKSMNNRSFRGIYNSEKGGEIKFKSRDEKYFSMFLDKNPEVKSFKYEKLSINYSIDRDGILVKRNAFPDFLVEFTDGSKALFEIKGEHLFKRESTNDKLKAIKEYCKNNKIDFTIITVDILFDLIKDDVEFDGKDYYRFQRRSKRFLEKASK